MILFLYSYLFKFSDVRVSAGNDVTTLTGLAVEMSGLYSTASFNLADASLATTGTTGAIEFLTKVNADNITAESEAIIVPGTTTSKNLVFNLSGKVYSWAVPTTTTFEKGKKYIYDAVLNNGSFVMLTPEATIIDWEIQTPKPIVPELQELGNGSEGSPLSATEALSTSSFPQVEVWVEGYIVGSTSKAKSFTSSSTNILIAASATETDESKCVVVDIDGSSVQSNLNIVANPTLIGSKVTVKGDLINTAFGNVASMENITVQKGGAASAATVFFTETFGISTDVDLNNADGGRPRLNNYTGLEMAAPFAISDPYDLAQIRSVDTSLPRNASLWMTIGSSSYAKMVISGIEPGYTNMTLSYDIVSSSAKIDTEGTGLPANANAIVVRANNTLVTGLPSFEFPNSKTFYTVTLSIPDGTTEIEFSVENVKIAYRIDNIKISGAK